MKEPHGALLSNVIVMAPALTMQTLKSRSTHAFLSHTGDGGDRRWPAHPGVEPLHLAADEV